MHRLGMFLMQRMESLLHKDIGSVSCSRSGDLSYVGTWDVSFTEI